MSDICTKNLPSKPFEKHSNKLVSDVGFFVRCNKTKFPPKKKIPRWRSRANRETRLRMRLGHISEYVTYIPRIGPNSKRYREIEWWGNEE